VFDPRLTLSVLGLTFAARLSCLTVLLVVAGGVLDQLGAETDANTHRLAWTLTAAAAGVIFLATLIGHEAIRQRLWRGSDRSRRTVELALFGTFPEAPEAATTPRSEVFGALAALIALGVAAGTVSGGMALTRDSGSPAHHLLKTLTIALLALTAMNAMPGLPLDGGRIFRAWMWYLTDDIVAATRLAALYAHAVAAALAIVGLALIFGKAGEPYWGLGVGVAGLQLFDAAHKGWRQARWQTIGPAITLREALPRPIRIPAETSVADAVDRLLADPPELFLLVVDDNAPIGILRLNELRGTRRTEWDQIPVRAIMKPLHDLPHLPAEITVAEALVRLAGRADAAAVVEQQRYLGVVTRPDLMAAIEERATFQDQGAR